MTAHVVPLARRSLLPPDLPSILRRLADQMESGEVTEFVAAATVGDAWEFVIGSSPWDAVALCALLQNKCMQGMYE